MARTLQGAGAANFRFVAGSVPGRNGGDARLLYGNAEF